MLLNFKTSNFKSFLDEVELKMTPAPKQKGLSYSVLHSKINKKEYKALSASVIYGPNAAGKTNIISAIDVFKNIILRGNIRDSQQVYSPDYAAWTLELIPNFDSSSSTPTTFSIEFIVDGIHFEYELSFLIGGFLNLEFDRKIVREGLMINEEPCFDRKEKNVIVFIDALKEYSSLDKDSYEKVVQLAENNLDDKELFLCNGFKNMFSKDLFEIFYKWVSNYFDVYYSSNTLKTNINAKSSYYDINTIKKMYNRLAKEIGTSTSFIDFVEENDGKLTMISCVKNPKSKKHERGVPSDIIESFGTTRFLNMFPILKSAIDKGGTIIIDELDSSINPMVIMSLINVFHNDEINKHGAQLIFNTHNPIFLNNHLLRRDEIKFVEKNDTTRISEIYSLSDFGTSGIKGVRKSTDYLKNYYINKYGALKYIDLSEVFKESEK